MCLFEYMDHKNLTPLSRLLMLVLLSKGNGIYPWAELCELVGVTVNTLCIIRRELIDAGMISYVRLKKHGKYTITLDDTVVLPSLDKCRGEVCHDEM